MTDEAMRADWLEGLIRESVKEYTGYAHDLLVENIMMRLKDAYKDGQSFEQSRALPLVQALEQHFVLRPGAREDWVLVSALKKYREEG